jgi:hypothetical protein
MWDNHRNKMTNNGGFWEISIKLAWFFYSEFSAENYLVRGRPPALPHRDNFLRCFLMVALPPLLPMQRGQISSVSL